MELRSTRVPAAPASPASERHLRAGVILGLATTLATLLGFAVTVVLARSLGPAEYGAFGALLGAATIGTIPAAGTQYVVARRTVTLGFGPDRNDGTALALSAVLGGALLACCVVVSPLARGWLHLDGLMPMVALGAALVPITVAGAIQGALLGHRRYGALGITLIINAIGRLAAGWVAVALGWGVAGVMVALAATAALTTGSAWLISGAGTWRRTSSIGDRALLAGVRDACSTVAGIVVLSNVDLLLARHYLDRETSGAYAVASLFAKAVLWGSQFVAQVSFPAFVAGGPRRALALRAGAATAAIGLLGVLVAAVAADPLVEAVTGGSQPAAATLVPWFALLGLLWALGQTLLLAAIAVGDGRPGRLLWVCVAVETLVIVLFAHRNAPTILTACVVSVAALVTAVAAVHGRTGTSRRAEPATTERTCTLR